jgi:hypothetical protein
MQNSAATLLRLPAADRCAATKPKQQRASKRITMRQASNMMAAVRFAREIGTPLNAHATIHWAGTKSAMILTVGCSLRFVKALTNGLGVTALLVDSPRYGCASDFQVVRPRWSTATCYSTWRTLLFKAEGASGGEGTGATDRPSR